MYSVGPESDRSKSPTHEQPMQLLQYDLWRMSLQSPELMLRDFEYPGINPRVQVNGDRLSTKKIGWQEIRQCTGDGNLRVAVGKCGTETSILDPRTNRSITPSYHQLEVLTDEVAVFRVGPYRFKLAANNDYGTHAIADRPAILRNYPAFLFAEKIRSSLLEPTEVPTTPTASAIFNEDDDPFGLKKPVDKRALLGSQVFQSAFRNTVKYASADKQTLVQLLNPDAPVLLPIVHTPEMSASLRFNTFSNGSSSVQLTNPDGSGGFILIEDASGNVTIMDSSLSKVTGRDDQDYKRYINEAKKYLKMYFAALKIKSSTEVLSGESMFDIRRQLGGMSTRAARKALRQAS